MPYRNKNKHLTNIGLYHAYNRGFERRDIFKDVEDYQRCINLIGWITKRKNDLHINAFCLMPNHYHFLIQQVSKYAMSRFLQVLNSEYTRYFNKKYHREGQLWQGTYKANKINNELEYQTIFNYIHKNPLIYTEQIEKYPYSSYGHYLGKFNLPFIKKGRPFSGK